MKKKKKLKLVTYRITLDYTAAEGGYHPSKWMEPEQLITMDDRETITWVSADEIPTPDEHRERLEEQLEGRP